MDTIPPGDYSQVISFDLLKLLTELVFIPSGYFVQIKDRDNIILWEDKETTKTRGDRRGEKCFFVNFGRKSPCPFCTAMMTLNNMIPYTKEDRSLIDGRWYQILAIPVLFNNEIHAIEIIKDITDSKNLRKEIFSLNSIKDLFHSIILHDFPNYLNIVSLSIEDSLTEMNSFSHETSEKSLATVQRLLKIAKRNVDRMSQVLTELRSFSFIEYDIKIAKNYQPKKTIEILNAAITESKRLFPDKKINTKVDVLIDGEEVFVLANNLLDDLFLNILKNAIQCSREEDEEVRIDIKVETNQTDNMEYVSISFSDYGVGVPPEIKKVFFDRKKKINCGWLPRKGSLGLGTVIMSTLVNFFGGTIQIKDRIAGQWTKGTTIVVNLPQAEKLN